MYKKYKRKILVVEDDEIVANLMIAILESEGFLVDVAKDGVEGLEKIKQTRYNVVISDYQMPGMNGEELYREIQKINKALAKRIIFISGIKNDFLISRGDMFLPKPFTAKELIGAVRKLIS